MDVEIGNCGGKKIADLAADGFEYVELAVPEGPCASRGALTDVIARFTPARFAGWNHTEPDRTVRSIGRSTRSSRALRRALHAGGLIGRIVRQSARRETSCGRSRT